MAKSINITDTAITAAKFAAGMVAGGFLNKVPFLQENPVVAGLAKIAVGALVASQLKGSMGVIGSGVAAAGVLDLGNKFAPTIVPRLTGIHGGWASAPHYALNGPLSSAPNIKIA